MFVILENLCAGAGMQKCKSCHFRACCVGEGVTLERCCEEKDK